MSCTTASYSAQVQYVECMLINITPATVSEYPVYTKDYNGPLNIMEYNYYQNNTFTIHLLLEFTTVICY